MSTLEKLESFPALGLFAQYDELVVACRKVMVSTLNRIVLVHPRPTRGGFTALVDEAWELADSKQYLVSVVVEQGARVIELPPTVEIYPLKTSLASWRGALQLRRICRSRSVNVVHLHGRQAGVVGRLVLRGINPKPVILYTPHGTPWPGRSWVRGLVHDLIERALLPYTDHVLCVSHSEMTEWARRDVSPKIRYIPNRLPSVVVAGNGTSFATGNVLVPSGYNPQKRLEVVLQALRLMGDAAPLTHLAGSVDRPQYIVSLKRQAEEMGLEGRVVFHSELKDIRAHLASASLIVLPSYSEGFPIIGLETLQAGANVAWSRIAPHHEMFGESGAPFWTAEELAEILCKPHEVASVVGRRPWLEKYSAETLQKRADFWLELERGRVE